VNLNDVEETHGLTSEEIVMPDDSRVQQLLDEILDSNRTPEDVCANDPVLLEEIRTRCESIRRLKSELDELFSCVDPTEGGEHESWNDENELPHIEGYDVQAVLGRGGMVTD
jgi:eukaryotic-like serine/threonine-protein kinase